MPAFTKSDFENREVIEKIQVIIMSQMGKHPLNSFRNLTSGEKKRFNIALNAYIRTFLSEADNWENILQTDFNTTCNDDIFTQTFKAEHNLMGCMIDTDIKELRLPTEFSP